MLHRQEQEKEKNFWKATTQASASSEISCLLRQVPEEVFLYFPQEK